MSLPLSLESLGPSAPVPCPLRTTGLLSPVVFNELRAISVSSSMTGFDARHVPSNDRSIGHTARCHDPPRVRQALHLYLAGRPSADRQGDSMRSRSVALSLA